MRAVRCELIGIWSINHHLDGRWKVVVNAGAAEFSSTIGFLNAWQFADRHAVTELDGIEPKIKDFIDDLITLGVA